MFTIIAKITLHNM